MKLAGMVALQEGRDRLRSWHYAESGNVEGSKAIIHLSRGKLARGYTIAKFDMVNAFSEITRVLCRQERQGSEFVAVFCHDVSSGVRWCQVWP